MAKTISDGPSAMADAGLRSALTKLQTAAVDFTLNSAGLAIKTTSSPTVKSANTIYYMIDGAIYSKAAGDMAALSGTVAAGSSNVFVFTIDAAGTITATAGTAATTVAGIVFPTIPASQTVIGFVIVTNGTASNFVGGTTALDTASLTVTYVNTPFPFNPNALSL